jgi:predicted small secreted protein
MDAGGPSPAHNQRFHPKEAIMNGRFGAGLVVLFLLAALQGCNTVRGLGQDIEAGGQKIEDGAGAVQKKL